MTKPTLYMLIGIPGSGKSTWVKLNKKSHVILSTDDYIEEQAKSVGKTYDEAFSFYIDSAMLNMDEMVKNACAQQKDVIWDQTNLDVNSRKRKLAKFDGYRKVAVVFEKPSEEVLKVRLASREGKKIPPRVIKSMVMRFQHPTLDEGFDEIVVVKND